jgi:hypothetical protein
MKTAERIFGPDEFRIWMDCMAMELFGISGAQFVMEYRLGRLSNRPSAHYLATVMPFLEDIEDSDPIPKPHSRRTR